jgi:tetratricopeptide (TPR) repeat protein
MAKKIMKQKKVKKLAKNNNNNKVKIEKKPYSEEERVEKLRQDRLTIAKRYEEMRLYDEAINYYKKLGLVEDVERVANIKHEIYLEKAKEFESSGKYDDAIRLFESLKLNEDVKRLKRLMDNEGYETQPEIEIEQIPSENNIDIAGDTPETIRNLDVPEIEETHVEPPAATVKTKSTNRAFKICPYCGEELDLPKRPNFCPFCKESFI